ncbi:DgyrCDS6797 [Dimorphilus gyrociliatus]|uniref:DgyrCDS6797 n=1 Tax=Dimorphilus gyrociliatus TaxID=2664684 RepID=A0A7I8VPQ0_9ANNE|nr:DgyrCDS6797 [Dimorphilus gyrociliatus]
MDAMLSLEDLVFYCIIRNFEDLKDNPFFLKRLRQKIIPPAICNKLFNGLNSFYGGIPEVFVEAFTSNNFQLNSVTFSDRNIDDEKCIEIFKDHEIKHLNLFQLGLLTVEDFFEFVDFQKLESLSINYCQALSCKQSFTKPRKTETDEQPDTSFVNFLVKSPPLHNLTKLDVSNTKIKDIQFYFITRKAEFLEDINISDTYITDLRLLKKQSNLQYLDCSQLSRLASRQYIHLHCLTKLKQLRFGFHSKKIAKLRLGWNTEINPLYKDLISKDDLEDFISVPDAFKCRQFWNISEFLVLADWKDLTFFDLVGRFEPSDKSICHFIRQHDKLLYFGTRYDELDIDRLSLETNRNLRKLMDINYYERKLSRSEMSFRALYSNYTPSKNPFKLSYFEHDMETTEIVFKHVVIRKVNEYKQNIPKLKNLRLCQILADELVHSNRYLSSLNFDLGNACLKILCLDIDKSEYFFTILSQIAQIFLRKDFRFASSIHFTFIEVLAKYKKSFRTVTNINYIYKKIFKIPCLKNNEGYYLYYSFFAFIKSLIKFLEDMDIESMSPKELKYLCLGMKNIAKWREWEGCEDLIRRLRTVVSKIYNYCSQKFNWNISSLNYESTPFKRKFILRGIQQWTTESGEEYDDEFSCLEQSSSEDDDWSTEK